MSNFKVGDKVKIIKRNPGNKTGLSSEQNAGVGEIGYIKEFITDKSFQVYSALKDDPNFYLGIFEAEELELVKEQTENDSFDKMNFQEQNEKLKKEITGLKETIQNRDITISELEGKLLIYERITPNNSITFNK